MADLTGNTLSTAYNLGTLGKPAVYSDWVGAVDSADWYKFTLAQTSSLRATLNGLTGNANLALYNSNGVSLVTRNSSGTTPEVIDVPLASGDYYIEITPASLVGNDAFYSLNLGADVIADNAGNSLATARSHLFGSAPIMYDDWVGIADSKDLYKVTLSSRSSLQASLYGLTQNISFKVLDSLGNTLPEFSTFSGKSFDLDLDVGTYYVQVAISTSAAAFYGAKYSLSLFNTTVRGGNKENDGAGKYNDPMGDRSKLITLTDTPQVINDWISSVLDNDDDYSFTLTNASFIKATLNARSGSASISILNSKGVSVFSDSSRDKNTRLVMETPLAAGRYIIRVNPYYSGEISYSLNISASITSDQAGKASFLGDSFIDQPKAITLTNTPQVINDWIGYGIDDYDDYSFTLTDTSFFRATLNGRSDNASFSLLDSKGSSIFSENRYYNSSPLTIDTSLAAGKYVIRVGSYLSGETAYSLNIFAPTIPDQAGKAAFTGDLFADQSKAITLTNTPQVINDWIGSGVDDYDDYSFTLTNTSFIRATLNGRSGGAALLLLDSKGGTILSDSQFYSDTPIVIDSSLAAGKYFIRVSSYSGKTAYSLNISAPIISDQAGEAAFIGDLFIDKSKSITLTNTPQVINDWIGSGVDDYDDYSFTLTNTSFIRAILNGRSDGAALSLFNSEGVSILRDSSYYGSPLVLDTSLVAGKYVIRVSSYSYGKTAYSLNVSSSIGIPTFIERSDDTLTTATNIPTGVVPIVINDRVGGADISDFYRLQLDKTSFLRATLNGNRTDEPALYQILDKDGQLLDISFFRTNEFALQAGTYYLKVVYPYSPNSVKYSFNLSSVEISDTAGSDLGAAKELVIGTTPLSSSEWVGGADPVDFYKFNLKESSFFQASLYGLTGNANFYLVDQDGKPLLNINKNQIGYSSNSGNSTENIYLPLAAGTYYLKIDYLKSSSYTTDQKSFSDSFYNLVISANPIGDLVGSNTPIPIITPINQFRAEYFNNIDPNIGTAVLVRNESSIDYNWGAGSPAAGVNADNFSVRWTGKFKFEEAGVYLFRNRADDGIRTWVDGQPIINEWNDHGATDYGAYLNMTAGEHDIKVEYYDRGADAVAKVLWEKGGVWTGIYFDKQDLTGRLTSSESFSTTTPSFSKDWGVGGPKDTPTDRFSALFDTTRWLPAGFYKIETKADDGIRVKINYKTVIDRWLINGQSQDSGFFQWAGGDVPIRVEYFENEGSAALNFNIKRVEKFSDQVQPNRWNATVFAWDPSQEDKPSVDFASGDFNNPNVIGITDLGSNVLSNGKQGFYGDWGSGALNKDGARLPNDYFAVRAYTTAKFDGGEYVFRAKADNGFQIFAKNQATGQWFYITPQASWEASSTKYKEYTYTLPQGSYDLHFHFYEKTGNASFDLNWEEGLRSKKGETLTVASRSGFTSFLRQGNSNIEREKDTILIIHGRGDDRNGSNIINLLNTAFQKYGSTHQILSLDWKDLAKDGELKPDTAAGAIGPVAQWAADTLKGWGISANNLSIFGHSLGSYVGSEIGRLFGKVRNLIAIDPAAGKYDIDGNKSGEQSIVDFKSVASNSLAFVVKDDGFGGIAGDDHTADRAGNSLVISYDGLANPFDGKTPHNTAIDVVADAFSKGYLKLENNLALPSDLKIDKYSHFGNYVLWTGTHEGIVTATRDGKVKKLEYTSVGIIDKPSITWV